MLWWLLGGDWLVRVTTGHDVDMTSSTLTVAVRAYGSQSVSGLVVLNSSEDSVTRFRPNAVDEFKVSYLVRSAESNC